MRALGKAARESTSVYLTGGATAVLHGWRASTIDIDVRIEPDHELLSAIADLKQRLDINVELASPLDFVPVASDWRERSPFIERIGRVSFHHFDLHAQALSKIERGHAQDVGDVKAMLERGTIDRGSMWAYFDRIAAELYRYPALDPATLERSIERTLGPRPEG